MSSQELIKKKNTHSKATIFNYVTFEELEIKHKCSDKKEVN